MHRTAPEALSVVNTMEVRSASRIDTEPNLVLDVLKLCDRSIFLPSFGEKPSKLYRYERLTRNPSGW
jgi:hypothetical protein